MRTWASFVAFILLVLTVSGILHFYLYERLLSLWAPSGFALSALRLGVVLLVLSPMLARFLERSAPRLYPAVWWAAAVWIGLAWYLLVLLLTGHLVESSARLANLWPGNSAFRLSVGLPAFTALVISIYGILQARRLPPVTELTVLMRDLPEAADGLTLVQITDLHIGALIGPERTAAIVAQINALTPDVVVITGDLVDERPARLEAFVPVLAALRTRLGSFAITGNHEFYAGVRESMALMRRAGIRVLENEGVELVPGLQLVGIHDPMGAQVSDGRFFAGPEDFERILGPQAKTMPTIVLHHQPIHEEHFAALGADLMLSGHTHGGQVWPFGVLSRMRYPRVKGRYEVGDMTLYVSRGTGQWGPPMRFGAPLELVRVTLRKLAP